LKDKINDLEKELDDMDYDIDALKIENEELFRDGDDFQLGIRQKHRRMRSMMDGLSKELNQLKSYLDSDSQWEQAFFYSHLSVSKMIKWLIQFWCCNKLI